MPRPALIFDFGNVIAYFDFNRAANVLGRELGLSGAELLDQLAKLGFGQLLQSYEQGRLSSLDFTKEVCGLVGLSTSHDDFAASWGDIFTANESILPLIEDLHKQGYRLILGSNTNDLHATKFRDQFAATLAYFDQLVLSYQVGQVKPHRDFYLACAEAAQRAPEDCIFIDDLLENIEGARAAGLLGCQYRSTGELVAELKDFGVVADPELSGL